jgi:hypothetical protein
MWSEGRKEKRRKNQLCVLKAPALAGTNKEFEGQVCSFLKVPR